MPTPIAQLLSELQPDPWRSEVGFSLEIEAANVGLFDRTASKDQLVDLLNRWIQKHQPCLFGRIAAKSGFLSYCILTESDLEQSDESILAKIQEARTAWTREGYGGRKSGFVLLAISERLARATPDEAVKQFALRLGSLYLMRDVVPDQICQDDIYLEKPGPAHTTWKWHAGVNYFSAQADKRWWQDHRIPGGVAFSTNSVGHMVKSGILSNAMIELDSALGAASEEWSESKVDSLGKALILAMRTIAQASDGPLGKATELLALPESAAGNPALSCPYELPTALAEKDFREYLGRYHTDYTIPTEYFRPDVERPVEIENHILDFTYLFQQGVNYVDFITMGEGRPVRKGDAAVKSVTGVTAPESRLRKMVPDEVPIDSVQRLLDFIDRG